MDLIEQFAARHFVLNNISEIRQRRHVRVLRDYDAWLGETPLLSATPEQVREWMTMQVANGLHVNTVRFHLNMLRPFWRWAWEAGHLDADSWLRLKDVKPPRGATGHSLPNPYTRKEIAELWRKIEDKHPLATPLQVDRWNRRNQLKRATPWSVMGRHGRRLQTEAIVALALYCGLRRTEIYNLGLDDLHPDNAYIVVRGKRVDHQEKVRKVPYTDAAREAVTRWLEYRKSLFIKTHRTVWLCLRPPRAREPMYETQFNSLLRQYGYELHRLRHTCATERLRAGMPLEAVQRLLGHASIQQTLGYAEVVARDVQQHAERSDEDFMKAVGKPRGNRRAA
jgi:site-specific recombinase XerD